MLDAWGWCTGTTQRDGMASVSASVEWATTRTEGDHGHSALTPRAQSKYPIHGRVQDLCLALESLQWKIPKTDTSEAVSEAYSVASTFLSLCLSTTVQNNSSLQFQSNAW